MKPKKLHELLPAARAKYHVTVLLQNGSLKELPHEIHLRETPESECQVIRFWHKSFEEELKKYPYERGVCVIERGRSWKDILGK